MANYTTIKKMKKLFYHVGLACFVLIISSCSLVPSDTAVSREETSSKEENSSEEVYQNIEVKESLFIGGDVPVYKDTVGKFSGTMIGYSGGDGKYGIYGKYEEDFEVELNKEFTTNVRIEYIFAPNQWCVTEFNVCDLTGRKMFGVVRDWLALSQIEFYDVGYIIDYRQNPNIYYAQGNQYSDIYETLNAKHLCTPKYNDRSTTGWISVEIVGENYIKISASVDENSVKPLEQVFKYDASKGYKIKICDGRQRTLDYIEESGAPTMREFRTCVMITSLKVKQ